MKGDHGFVGRLVVIEHDRGEPAHARIGRLDGHRLRSSSSTAPDTIAQPGSERNFVTIFEIHNEKFSSLQGFAADGTEIVAEFQPVPQ